MAGFAPSYGVNNLGQYDYNGVSSDPSLATNWSPSLAAAMQQWFAANPTYSADQGGGATDPNATGPNNAGPPPPPGNAATQSGYNPLQPEYLGAPSTINATTGSAAYYTPTDYQASTLSPQLMNSLGVGQTEQALQNSVAPQYGQQDQQMMQMLATAGVAPSSTAGSTIFNNLAQQQLAGISPAMASAIQNSQANQLSAGQFNSGALNTAGATNAAAANTAGQYNAGAANNMTQFNANAQNAAAQQNLQNSLQQQLYNANAYNAAGNNYFNAQTGAYNNNANAFNALNSQGLSGATGLAGQQASGGTQMGVANAGQFPAYSSQGAASFGAGVGGYGYGYAPQAQTQPSNQIGSAYSQEGGY